jgi:hypothetical protein
MSFNIPIRKMRCTAAFLACAITFIASVEPDAKALELNAELGDIP